MAFGGLRALRDLGRGDVSVVGFDDVDAARIAGLTTVAPAAAREGGDGGAVARRGRDAAGARDHPAGRAARARLDAPAGGPGL